MSVTTPYTTAAVTRAREHYAAEWSIASIRDLIEREFGRRPQWITVKGWVDEEYAERRRRLVRRANRLHMVRKVGRRPVRNVSADWKLERMRELHDHGLSFEAIGHVADVWWGEPLSEIQVAKRLRRKPATRKYERRRAAA